MGTRLSNYGSRSRDLAALRRVGSGAKAGATYVLTTAKETAAYADKVNTKIETLNLDFRKNASGPSQPEQCVDLKNIAAISKDPVCQQFFKDYEAWKTGEQAKLLAEWKAWRVKWMTFLSEEFNLNPDGSVKDMKYTVSVGDVSVGVERPSKIHEQVGVYDAEYDKFVIKYQASTSKTITKPIITAATPNEAKAKSDAEQGDKLSNPLKGPLGDFGTLVTVAGVLVVGYFGLQLFSSFAGKAADAKASARALRSA